MHHGTRESGAEDFEALGGRGVRARIEGRSLLVGTRRLMEERGIDIAALARRLDQLLMEGKTLTIVAVDGKLASVVAVQDTPRLAGGPPPVSPSVSADGGNLGVLDDVPAAIDRLVDAVESYRSAA